MNLADLQAANLATEMLPSAVIEAAKRATWSLRDTQDLIRAIHSTLSDNRNGLQYELERTLDEISDLIHFDEQDMREAEEAREWQERQAEEAAIMRSWK